MYNLIIATGAVCVSELKHFFLMHIYFCMCGRFDVSKVTCFFVVVVVLQAFYCVCCNHVWVIKGSKERVYGH